MRGKIATLLLLASAAVVLGGCGAVMGPVPGFLYTDAMGPMSVDGSVEAKGVPGAKEGKACANTILGWVGTGDASIATAASNGGIRTIKTIDYKAKHILGIIGEFCTVVRGE